MFDLVRYWYVNGRPSRMDLANVSSDLQSVSSYSVSYIQYNWHGDAVTYVSLDGADAGIVKVTYDPWGNPPVGASSQRWNYYGWNGGWGYLLFSYLGESYDGGHQGLYYVHGRWYSPDTGMFLSPNEKGDYIYGGDGPDAINWAWFLYGLNCQFYNDYFLGFLDYQPPLSGYRCQDFYGNEFFIGQVAGRSLSNLAGGIEFLLGGGLTFGGGGVTIGSGGTFSIVSVPTALGGIAALSHGTAILVRNTLSPPPILYAKGSTGSSRINITADGLQHIIDNHSAGKALPGKSTFLPGEDIHSLIRQAEKVVPTRHRSGAFQWIVDAGRKIGIDRDTGNLTSVYTVITDASGNLITAFPGLPRP